MANKDNFEVKTSMKSFNKKTLMANKDNFEVKTSIILQQENCYGK